MKRFSSFLTRLKPYKRLYKIFWMITIILLLFIFQMIMLTFTLVVPHNQSGFYYWFNGLHSLLGESRGEPNSTQGFIFAATIIGFIPIIPIIPVLYFTFANWLIEEKLSDKFINVPKDKYLKWSKFIHYSILAGVFLLIPGLLTIPGGGTPLPHHAFNAIPGAFTNDFLLRTAGISAFLYYGVGCVFGTIILFWTLGMILSWIAQQISIFINSIKLKLNEWKEEKRARKLEKMEEKTSRKKK